MDSLCVVTCLILAVAEGGASINPGGKGCLVISVNSDGVSPAICGGFGGAECPSDTDTCAFFLEADFGFCCVGCGPNAPPPTARCIISSHCGANEKCVKPANNASTTGVCCPKEQETCIAPSVTADGTSIAICGGFAGAPCPSTTDTCPFEPGSDFGYCCVGCGSEAPPPKVACKSPSECGPREQCVKPVNNANQLGVCCPTPKLEKCLAPSLNSDGVTPAICGGFVGALCPSPTDSCPTEPGSDFGYCCVGCGSDAPPPKVACKSSAQCNSREQCVKPVNNAGALGVCCPRPTPGKCVAPSVAKDGKTPAMCGGFIPAPCPSPTDDCQRTGGSVGVCCLTCGRNRPLPTVACRSARECGKLERCVKPVNNSAALGVCCPLFGDY
ncbi:uncharacterized protein LOC127876106 isoform X1 [Dreissena polymorpha]|uniref:uncharacterized protein LOC127876106 isoform X1 n=1 Tax=Dreissena polymorpha TaxID=45954 RepID=UPI0022653883|nr:uncharacterized protein LOC127876106 isoform X1 [Dreissena polymorpha]